VLILYFIRHSHRAILESVGFSDGLLKITEGLTNDGGGGGDVDTRWSGIYLYTERLQ